MAGGDGQTDTSLMGVDTSSPTVATENLFSVIAIAASERRHHASVDIVGAFLEAEMTGPPVHMVIQPLIAKAVISERPAWSQYLRQDGSMVVQLIRALYGCKQSEIDINITGLCTKHKLQDTTHRHQVLLCEAAF